MDARDEEAGPATKGERRERKRRAKRARMPVHGLRLIQVYPAVVRNALEQDGAGVKKARRSGLRNIGAEISGTPDRTSRGT